MPELPPVAVAGEAVTDFVPGEQDGLFRAAPGGSPANVAVGLSRLDVPVRLLARLSPDLLGRRLRAHLEGNGVDLSFSVPATEPSSLAIVALGEDGSAQYDFRLDGTADWQWTDEELAGALDGVAALVLGSLAVLVPPGCDALRRLADRARGRATIVYDPNLRPAVTGLGPEVRTAVEDLAALADVVKVSEEDLAALHPQRDVADVARKWLDRGPALVVVTRGAAGALAVGRSCGLVERAGRQVAVVDTVGAGDAFQAALVAGLAERSLLGAGSAAQLRALPAAALEAVVDRAVAAAALTCARQGADPPTRAALASYAGN